MKRFLIALVIGGTVLGGVTAFAASLGGVTVNGFGAGHAAIASCDSDGVNIYAAANNWREDGIYVTVVTLSGVDAACGAHPVAIVLHSSDGTVIGSGGGGINAVLAGGPGQDFPVSDLSSGTNGVKAESIAGVSIVIH
jgi:hypothetical protein